MLAATAPAQPDNGCGSVPPFTPGQVLLWTRLQPAFLCSQGSFPPMQPVSLLCIPVHAAKVKELRMRSPCPCLKSGAHSNYLEPPNAHSGRKKWVTGGCPAAKASTYTAGVPSAAAATHMNTTTLCTGQRTSFCCILLQGHARTLDDAICSVTLFLL